MQNDFFHTDFTFLELTFLSTQLDPKLRLVLIWSLAKRGLTNVRVI